MPTAFRASQDGTLVTVKSKARFALDADDWKWFNKTVPKELHRLHDEGYQLVIFSNQGGIKSALAGVAATKTRARVDNICAALARKDGPIPVQVFLATLDDEFRKPEAGLWTLFKRSYNRGIEPGVRCIAE